MPSPIVLFVYNRPEHTRRTLESLSANRGFDPSLLTVFADGPPPASSKELLAAVEKTRAVVRSFSPRVALIESSVNLGLGRSILRGVGYMLERHETVVVLEDDLVLSPGFLEYMNAALDFYRNVPRVMHISGFMFPVDVRLPETFFYRPTTCWGWATWRDRWQKLISDPVELYRKVYPQRYAFNLEGAYDFFAQIENNAANGLETWAILWQATVFLENGLCLHPGKSLVTNIGFDGSGENSRVEDAARPGSLADAIRVEKIPLVESAQARAAMRRFYLRGRASWWARERYRMLNRIPLEVRRYIRSLIVPSQIKIRRELARLEKGPLHVPGTTNIFGRTFAYADAARFVLRYRLYYLTERYILPENIQKIRIVVTLAEDGLLIKFLSERHPDAQIVAFDP
ncbi:MAG: glycosyltransferase, partial [Bacteroidia bacterium]|nr:glycosyltransferase [Bacteroidia bacterium]